MNTYKYRVPSEEEMNEQNEAWIALSKAINTMIDGDELL